ncbi:MAG: DNA repair protein RecN [Magnetovibrionaceae bacterium]
MLISLSIRDVVLISRLDLSFQNGLCVLTGETGAGKSILLDSLGLALGMRAEARLVRHGAERAQVTAVFDCPAAGPVASLLEEGGIAAEDGVILLRRALTPDGRSKAYINDQPVSVGLLRQVGDALVEVHGQFESQRLMDPKGHRDLLDAYGRLTRELEATSLAHGRWRAAARAYAQAKADFERARQDEDFLRHALDELEKLGPLEGEEKELSDARALMQASEKLTEAIGEAQKSVSNGKGVEAGLMGAMRPLERVAPRAEGRFEPVIEAFGRALAETSEALVELNRLASSVDQNPAELERIEERLFALRAMARKHQVDVDKLPALMQQFRDQVTAVDDGGARLGQLQAQEAEARAAYEIKARALSEARAQAAAGLDEGVMTELVPLKLDRARFVTAVEPSANEADWGADGWDRVAFQVATNPGAAPGPIGKIASGGELSRFMLALKAVLASADSVPTLIFDEVDAGVGGATAAAVGERLAKLGQDVQVLVVTHSPQVAARGAYHLQIAKREEAGAMFTSARELAAHEREAEIARMLAGETVTDEARRAAASLMNVGA